MSAIQFSIDEALLRDVDEEAKREHLDRSKLIRKALIRYLDEARHAEREAQHRAGYEKYPQDASELADWEGVQTWPER